MFNRLALSPDRALAMSWSVTVSGVQMPRSPSIVTRRGGEFALDQA